MIRRPAEEPRFFADAMLGGLARWLRMLGYDTEYVPHIADDELVRRASRERRVLLTRDRRLVRDYALEHAIVPESEDPLEQLGEVVAALRLSPAATFDRCSRCNLLLEPLPPGREAGVPEGVLASGLALRHCVGCGRVYWEGTHTERMRRAIADAVDRERTERE